MTNELDAEHWAVIDQARQALKTNILHDNVAAMDVLEQMMRTVESHDAVQLAIITWIDCLATCVGWRHDPDAHDPPRLMLAENQEDLPSHITECMEWIAGIMHARLTMNEDAFYSHLAAVNTTNRLTWIQALFDTCTATIRAAFDERRALLAAMN